VVSDRAEAGRQLAVQLVTAATAWHRPIVVVGLPRGGVPVAAPIADALNAPLDVVLVRKLGTPGQRELALGAIGEHGVVVLNADLVAILGISHHRIAAIERRARLDLHAQAELLRGNLAAVDVVGATVVVVDDGIATGATARAAAAVLRVRGAARVVLATPVAPPDWRPGGDFDEAVVSQRPDPFVSVGLHYRDFGQVTDAEVTALLADRMTRRP
jgi:putative phosphoribosyl transferase